MSNFLTAQQLTDLTDSIGQAYDWLEPAMGWSSGVTLPDTAAHAAEANRNRIIGWAAPNAIRYLLPGAMDTFDLCKGQNHKDIFNRVIDCLLEGYRVLDGVSLDAAITAAGVRLYSGFATLLYDLKGIRLSADNVFSPVITMGTVEFSAPNTATFTDGDAVSAYHRPYDAELNITNTIAGGDAVTLSLNIIAHDDSATTAAPAAPFSGNGGTKIALVVPDSKRIKDVVSVASISGGAASDAFLIQLKAERAILE